MITVRLEAEDDFDVWRDAARGLVAAKVSPAEVNWQIGDKAQSLFAGNHPEPIVSATPLAVPRAFVELAKTVICHSDPERFALLYQLLADLMAGRRKMDDAADGLIRRLAVMAQSVRRDIHKMRAFLRFRSIPDDNNSETFIAWYEPEHHIVRINAAFFTSRFANMRWSILTPLLSLHWDGEILHEGSPSKRSEVPASDSVEEHWHAYYRSIFNPARLKVRAMLKEMPKKYWRNMPETAHVPEMIASAQARTTGMLNKEVRMGTVKDSLEQIRADAHRCRRCPLHAPATQMVFGEGPEDARLMIVGEQPGDEEDKAGRPFVGPAGQLLDAALQEAGVDRSAAYVTNAVKHFKFEMRGKRRIHQRPNAGEIDHCRWWLKREIDLVKPDLIVALGATAIRSLTGKPMAIKDARTRLLQSQEGVPVLATIHPSYLLRLPDRDAAERERAAFVDDLRRAQDQLALAA